MDTIIIILIILSILVTFSAVIIVFVSIYTKSYLSYRQKLIEFEKKKKRIEEELENERKHFKRNS